MICRNPIKQPDKHNHHHNIKKQNYINIQKYEGDQSIIIKRIER